MAFLDESGVERLWQHIMGRMSDKADVTSVDASIASLQSEIDAHKSNNNNPHDVSLSQLGVTSTAAELNYTDGVTSNIQTQLNNKLEKTTYEYNRELAIGSAGKVCIGKFPMYDSNISVEIKSTTNVTYNGTLVIATQNINTALGGTYTATVYGDADNSLTNSIKIQYLSGSNVFSVYIDLPSWSKNLIHIQCVALKGEPTDIATLVDEVPSTATIVPTNALIAAFNSKPDIVAATSTDGIAYTATTNHITATSLSELKGVCITIIPNITSESGGNVTLNVNGLGAKGIKRNDSLYTHDWWSFDNTDWMRAGYPVPVMFDGTYWMVMNRQKTYASDLQGTVPVNKGGTGVTSHTDTAYTTARYRASALVNAETDPTVNGVINWIYE